MILIPKYLRCIATKIKENNERLTMSICCDCGNDNFILFKNIPKKAILSNDKKRLIKKSEKWWHDEYDSYIEWPICGAFYEYPELGYREVFVYNKRGIEDRKFDKELDKNRVVKYFKLKYGEFPLSIKEINEMNPKDYTIIIYAKCSKCGKKHLLFDSRIHGCDAVEFSLNEILDYEFKEKVFNKNVGKSYKIEISIKNYWGFDDIESNGNDGLTIDDYSILFNHIAIKAIDEEKKIKVYSEELG